MRKFSEVLEDLRLLKEVEAVWLDLLDKLQSVSSCENEKIYDDDGNETSYKALKVVIDRINDVGIGPVQKEIEEIENLTISKSSSKSKRIKKKTKKEAEIKVVKDSEGGVASTVLITKRVRRKN